jgi:hypothetical protein
VNYKFSFRLGEIPNRGPHYVTGRLPHGSRKRATIREPVPVSNEQLYLAIGVPMAFNALLITIVVMSQNSRFDSMQKYIDQHFNVVDQRFSSVDQRFREIDRRFDDLKELWRAELHRVEEILDARLKHLEED